MLSRESVQTIILNALKSLNDERDTSQKFKIDLNTCLFGESTALDSLSLVSVIVDTETALSMATGHTISLADDRALSQAISPFSNVTTLTDYVLLLLSEISKNR